MENAVESNPAPESRSSEQPPLDLLDHVILDPERDMPLHAQLRRSLRRIIEERCSQGQKFFTEPQLIDRLGVSQSTVRRALLDLTRDGLLERRVAKGSFVRRPHPGPAKEFVVHLFLPDWKSDFLMAMLDALSTACRHAHYSLMVHHTQKGENTQAAYRSVQGTAEEHGIILFSNEPRITLDLYEAFSDHDFHIVNIDCLIQGYPGAFVGTNNAEVVKLALDHLQSLSHRRICFFINEPEGHGNVLERSRLFREESRLRGLSEASIFHCGTRFYQDGYEMAYQKMPELMKRPKPPTAIFAMSDPGAWAAIKWLNENGYKIPEDISVLGFSDDRTSRFTSPPLTTIAHPVPAMAAAALEMLAKPELQETTRFLMPELVLRGSTAARK